MTRIAMVRQLLNQHGFDTMPVELAKLMKKEFQVTLTPNVVSTYKSAVIKEDRKKSATYKVPKSWAAVSKTIPEAKAITKTATVDIDDVIAFKKMVDRLGVDNFRKLAEALS